MTDPSSPPALATALAYHQAWTSHNLDQAMTVIAPESYRLSRPLPWAGSYRIVVRVCTGAQSELA